MKYYSDVLDKFFDSEDECIKAERESEAQFKKDAERADREIELKALRKDVTRLRKELDSALEKFYAAQHEYFNDYGRLCPSVDAEDTENKTDGDYCYRDFGRILSDYPVNLDVELAGPIKEKYPRLWDLFYGGH